MERIDDWLRGYVSARGWTTEHTFYSKRSFLREAVTLRPELAPPASSPEPHSADTTGGQS